MAVFKLQTPLSEVIGIQKRFIGKLKRMGIETVRDLIWHFPTRYEDFSKIYKIAELIPNQEATIQGMVNEIGGRRTWRRRLYMVEALISDETGSIRAVWFNQPYIKNILQPGRLANFSGKVASSKEGELYLSNPTYELVTARTAEETKHTARIVPVYPETRGLTSRGLRYFVKPILDDLERIEEPIPKEILERKRFLEINEALSAIHFPAVLDDALAAKKRFAFEDLFFLQLHNLEEKLRLRREKAVAIPTDIEDIKKIIAALPFALTASQKQSLWEIVKDLEKPHPMNRLLQGDVGSGKTIIAAIAALETARAGYETAFMAPTEILARQHFGTLTKFFPRFEGGIALLTGSESKISYGHGLGSNLKKQELKRAITDGKVKIVVGTHALIEKTVVFSKLALVVVDEQHRFGVRQRAALTRNNESGIRNKGNEKPIIPNSSFLIPHFLSMSATPIPRTLSLTIFGDLDLSLITELPKNRKPIITKIVDPENRSKAYAFIRGQVKKGRQVFVICPRIAAPENGSEPRPFGAGALRGTAPIESEIRLLEVKTVKEEFEKLSTKTFPDLRVGMLHGKMPAKEKETVMKKFTGRAIDVLVSTAVVEVGVDVPNASIMMIESAERFGLAQLYQFRGRVGRGEHQSFCFLFTESSARSTHDRLKSIVDAKNGFELAERDLKLRGPGEFLGEIQTGMPDLAMKALQNPELVKEARDEAVRVLKNDPALTRHPILKTHLAQFEKDVHSE